MVSKVLVFLLALSSPLTCVLGWEDQQAYGDLAKRYQKVLWLLDQTNVLGKMLESEAQVTNDKWKNATEEQEALFKNGKDFSKKLRDAERLAKMSEQALAKHKDMKARVEKERDHLSLKLRGGSMKADVEKEQVEKGTSANLLKQYHRGQWALDQAKVLGKRLEEEMWNATSKLESLQEEAPRHKDDEEFLKKLRDAERLTKISHLALMRLKERKARTQKDMDYLGLKLRGVLMKVNHEDYTMELNVEAEQMRVDATLQVMELRQAEEDKEKAQQQLREKRWKNIHDRQKVSADLVKQYRRGQWALEHSKALGKKLEEETWKAEGKLKSLQEEAPLHTDDQEFLNKLASAERVSKNAHLALLKHNERRARVQKEVDYLGLKLRGVLMQEHMSASNDDKDPSKAQVTANGQSPSEPRTVADLVDQHQKTLNALEQLDEDMEFLKTLKDNDNLSQLRRYIESRQEIMQAKFQQEMEHLASKLREDKDAGVLTAGVELTSKQMKFDATLQMMKFRQQQEDKDEARKQVREERWKSILERQALAERYQKILKAQGQLRFLIQKAQEDTVMANDKLEKLQEEAKGHHKDAEFLKKLKDAERMNEMAKLAVTKQKEMQTKLQAEADRLASQLLPITKNQEKEAEAQNLASIADRDLPPSEVFQEEVTEPQILASIADRDPPPSEVLQEEVTDPQASASPADHDLPHSEVRHEEVSNTSGGAADHDLPPSEVRQEKAESLRMVLV